jgi:hypothetical protein
MKDDSWGPPKDLEVWTRLLTMASDNLAHRLWCAIIREIATAVSERSSVDDWDESEPDRLAKEWQDEALPYGANLAWILGELDYIREIDLSWDEKLSLSGEACGYSSDVISDLKGQLSEYPDAREAVTEEAVEDFYSEWRTRFLRRVFQEVKSLNAEGEKKN